MLSPSDKFKHLSSILESGFLLFREKWLLCLFFSFSGIACLALPLVLKTEFYFPSTVNFGLSLIAILCAQIFFGGLLFFLYSHHKHLSCSVKKALSIGIKKLPIFIITVFIYSLMIFIGTIAFVLPGLFLSITCVFGLILPYTDNYDPILALTTSFKWSKPHFFSISLILWVIGLFVLLSNLLGLSLGYLLFIGFQLNPAQLFFSNLTLIAIINALVIPIAYGIMIHLLSYLKNQELRIKN